MRYWIAFFFLLILVGCGGGGGASSGGGTGNNGNIPIPPDITLERVEIVPTSAQVPLGISLELQLLAIYSNGVRVDVTTAANFSSNHSSFSINGGAARAETLGSAQVTGSFQGKTASAQLQATAATLRSLSLLPPTASVPAGLSQTYQVMGSFSDNSQMDVTSSASLTAVDGSVAQLAAPGRLLALRSGTTEVRANLNNQQATATLTVTAARLDRLEVSPNPLSLPVGLAQNFLATGYFSDGSHRDVTSDAEWQSEDAGIFFIANLAGNKGQGGALTEGSTQVRASIGSVTASSPVTVTEAVLQSLTLSPSGVQLPVGLTQAFVAHGRYSDGSQRPLTNQVIWSSTNFSAATISNAPSSSGQATALQVGITKIQAELGGVSAEVDLEVVAAVLQSIEVAPADQSLPLGFTQQFSATGRYSDGMNRLITQDVSWTTSNLARATVNQTGLVTPVSQGVVEVQAQLGSVQGKTTLTVTPAVLESLTVTPSKDSLPKGATRQFDATGTFSDQSERNVNSEVTWSSQSEGVATVSNQAGSQGRVTAVELGTTTIQAQSGSLQASAQLTVTAATMTGLEFAPSNASRPEGSLENLHVLARYSDGSVQDVTAILLDRPFPTGPGISVLFDDPNVAAIQNFFSSDPSKARVLYFKNTGTTRMHVTYQGATASTNVTVTDAQLVSLEVTPEGAFLASGQTQELTALGHYSDGSIVDLTTRVNWSSLNQAAATISNAPGSQGLWTALATGQATLQAEFEGVQGQTVVRVNDDQRTGLDWLWRQGKGPQMLSLTAGDGLWVGIDNYRSFVSNDGRTWRSYYLKNQALAQGTGPLAFGGGVFLAHTGGGEVARSLDARNWTSVTLPGAPQVFALAYGNGRFVALASERAQVSDDLGQSWTATERLAASYRLEYVNGRFYNLGTATTLVSTTGDSWSALTLPVTFQARSLAFDGSRYMVAGTGGRIYSSPDLVHFTLQNVPGSTRDFVKVVAGAGGFVAVNDRGNKFSTASGPDWVAVGQPTTTLLGYRADSGFLAPGGTSPDLAAPQLSIDGVNWESLTPVNDDLNPSEGPAISFGPLGFMLSGLDKFWLSNDGLSWTPRPTSELHGGLSLLKYLGGRYYLVGSLLDTFGKVSQNGLDYRTLFTPPGQLTYGKGLYVRLELGRPSFSSDGLNWTPGSFLSGQYFGAAFGGGRFVLVGTNQAAYSENGMTFSEVAIPSADLRQVEYAFGRFVAVSRTKILTSTDGAVWTQVTGLPGTPSYQGVCVGNGLVVVYGGGIIWSRDGVNWQTADTAFVFTSLAAGFGRFVGVSPGGLLTSP